MKTPNLIRNYEQSVNALVKAFCQKQYVKFDSDMWADRVGGIILINHCYLNFCDIFYDMQTEQPKRLIFEWYTYNETFKKYVSYEGYIRGFRHDKQDSNIRRCDYCEKEINIKECVVLCEDCIK